MRYIFIVFGYGVSENILEDKNYNNYLTQVFNKVFDTCVENNTKNPVIILTGGPTDCYPPYRRTEAGEMNKFFLKMKKRKDLKAVVKDWKFVLEKRSLSMLDNLLYSQEWLDKSNNEKVKIYIFTEKTRLQRTKRLSKKIFFDNFVVIPIDFDNGLHRYIDRDYIEEKEKFETKRSLEALKSPKNLEEFRKAQKERVGSIREAGIKNHTKAVKEAWDKASKTDKK